MIGCEAAELYYKLEASRPASPPRTCAAVHDPRQAVARNARAKKKFATVMEKGSPAWSPKGKASRVVMFAVTDER